jgi:hypothetical protein
VEGLGIGSVASLFTDFGYQRRDRLVFPNKKLQVPCLQALAPIAAACLPAPPACPARPACLQILPPFAAGLPACWPLSCLCRHTKPHLL